MSDIDKKFEMWLFSAKRRYEYPLSGSEAFKGGYNQGRVDERNRIVERIKDNLTPSVAETVIAIIYAA